MGSLWTKLFTKKDVNVVMMGLDAAGKTSILYRWRLGECVKTIPTVGYNMETVVFENVTFNLWDIGLGNKGRHLLRHGFYTEDKAAVIFVIDSCDRERLADLTNEVLVPFLDVDETREVGTNRDDKANLLFLANKQDLPNVMTVEEIREALGLQELLRHRHCKWTVMPSSAKTGDGVWEALHWIGQSVGHLPPLEPGTVLLEVKVQDDLVSGEKVDLIKPSEYGSLSWALQKTTTFFCGRRY